MAARRPPGDDLGVDAPLLRSRLVLAGLGLLAAGGLLTFACSESRAPLIQRITSTDQLLQGPEAAGRVGDWLLSNGRVRFIVQDAGSSTGWGLYGGSLVDLAHASGPADDRLQELFYQCELRAFAPDLAELVSDGSDGKPAILRLTGHDRGIPLIDAAFGTQDLGLDLTVDYVLPPDGETLEVVLRAKSSKPMGSRELACGVVLIRGDETVGFYDGTGFGDPAGDLDYLASAAPDGDASWVIWAKDRPLSLQLPQADVMPLTTGSTMLPGGGTLEQHFYVAVGRGDVESALAERRRIVALAGGAASAARAAPLPAARAVVHTKVTAPSGLAIDPSRVVLTFLDAARASGRDAVTSARPDASTGVATAELPEGRYTVRATFEERDAGSIALEVPAGAAGPVEATLELASLGQLDLDITRVDRDGAALGPTAAKLVLVRGAGAAPTDAVELERYVTATDRVILPAGAYTAFVSHGPEDELDRQDVTITAGAKTALHATVRRVVDTRGWVSADLHVHSARSVDAQSPRPTRVLGAVGEGLEILVSTDHDIVTDYGPIVRALGLERDLRTVTGTEVSPAYGHINGFPLPVETPEAYWRVKWFRYHDDHSFDRNLEPAEIVRLLRDLGVKYVQLNHPRSGQGVFNYIRLDADTAESERELPAADGFEILNSRGGGPFDESLRDLITLVRHNHRFTATGVSDAHSAYDGVGWARTMIAVAEDEPAKVDLDQAFQALREGHVVALSGPMVTLTATVAGGARAGIGDTLAAPPGADVALHLHVEAPSWMEVGHYRLLADGEVLAEGDLGPADRPAGSAVVRLDRTFHARPTKDAFYLAIVEGPEGSRNEPVMHARARTVTNPVFVDANGGGFHFEP